MFHRASRSHSARKVYVLRELPHPAAFKVSRNSQVIVMSEGRDDLWTGAHGSDSHSVAKLRTRALPDKCLTPNFFLSAFSISYRPDSSQSKDKGSPYSITERRVPELISVLGSEPAVDVSHKPGGRGRLPLLSARPAVTPATLKRAANNFAAW